MAGGTGWRDQTARHVLAISTRMGGGDGGNGSNGSAEGLAEEKDGDKDRGREQGVDSTGLMKTWPRP